MTGLLRAVGLVLLVALLCGLLLWTRRTRRAGSPAPEAQPVAASAPEKPLPFSRSADCVRCHAAIGEEWAASRHSKAWWHPLLPRDPGRTECSACHIPRPIYETGLEAAVQVRATRHEEAVDCIACHVRGNHSLGPGPTREAPCNPRHEPTISRSITCAPCHAFHGTHEEWKRSKFFAQSVGCQDCHMRRVTRPLVAGGPPRPGRSHVMLGGRDPELLANCLTVAARIEGRKLVVTLTNDRTGHAVPGEISNRRLFLVLVVTGRDGKQSETFRAFQAPPRPKRGVTPSTQIQPGQTVREERALPPGPGRAVVTLEYKLLMIGPSRTFYRKELRW